MIKVNMLMCILKIMVFNYNDYQDDGNPYHMIFQPPSMLLVIITVIMTGLSVVIQTESNELVPILKNPVIYEAEIIHDSSATNNRIFNDLFFEFCHAILLQFTLEELSQVSSYYYPRFDCNQCSVILLIKMEITRFTINFDHCTSFYYDDNYDVSMAKKMIMKMIKNLTMIMIIVITT